MIKEGQFLNSSTHNNHGMGFQKKRKSLITDDMVEDIDMNVKEEIIEVDSGDKVSQHSGQEVVTRVNVRDSATTDFPQFEVKMRKSYVSPPCQMNIPMGFAKQHHLPNLTTFFTLRNMKGKKWSVQLYCAPQPPQRRCFLRGWKAFVIDNSLKVGDCCKFELVDEYEMLCHIYRYHGKNCSPETSTSRGQNVKSSMRKVQREKGINEKDVPVPDASRCAAKCKSPHNASAQTESVDSLLHYVGLDKYSDILHAEEIDIDALKLMTEEDLKLLDVPMGPRKKIIDALKSSI
ncbi:Sterile alpha motif (SAM) domain-containing protein [Thalictrum thalictroides]|uniref:Sterile alpha motif (SAM) domain-containing protein n=1 Tax=Thalictrum thalictroides TaxID=46969 RepID=A0A7J6X674_THATH|nr:Sterile alpha motif (SAM) domain-containing protein [Thalictrum thalictroides]